MKVTRVTGNYGKRPSAFDDRFTRVFRVRHSSVVGIVDLRFCLGGRLRLSEATRFGLRYPDEREEYEDFKGRDSHRQLWWLIHFGGHN